MLRTIGACLGAIGLLSNTASAYHPFVGEHAEESTVVRDDGTMSMKLTQRNGSYDKYSTIHDTKTQFQARWSYQDAIQEMLFGKTRAQQIYEQALEQKKNARTKISKNGRKRLQQDDTDHITAILETNNG